MFQECDTCHSESVSSNSIALGVGVVIDKDAWFDKRVAYDQLRHREFINAETLLSLITNVYGHFLRNIH